MTKIDNKIKNIYYMLCYVFNQDNIKEIEEEKVGEEAFDNIYDLFSMLLCLMLKKQLKKGMHKDYKLIQSETSNLKGKIKIEESIKNNSLVKRKMVCEFDDFTENVELNQIIKTTVFYLLKTKRISIDIKKELRKINLYYSNVDLINIKSIDWNLIRYDKSTAYYRNTIFLCKLILTGMIVSDNKGKIYFKQILDDSKISYIYENFLKAYFKKHFPELNASSKIYRLNEYQYDNNLIPVMKTDITLEYDERKLIIDAKYYSKILSGKHYGSRVINSNNIFQILAYVDNQDPYKEGSTIGMLLYAQTIEEKEININEKLNNHLILIKTLDLNTEWNNIKNQLDEIALNFINNTYK